MSTIRQIPFNSRDIIAQIPDDLIDAVIYVIINHKDRLKATSGEIQSAQEKYKTYMILYNLLLSHGEDVGGLINYNVDLKKIVGAVDSFINNKWTDFTQRREVRKIANEFESIQNEVNSRFNEADVISFSVDELEEIQRRINELRKYVQGASLFTEDHKRRILRKLEKLQAELHKSMSDIDRFWGLVAEAGTTLKKFGEDASVFVDLVNKVIEIPLKAYRILQGLPPGENIPLDRIEDK